MVIKINLSKLSALLITAISLSLLFTPTAFGVGPSTHPSPRVSLPSQATTHLEGVKLQACQARENAIKTRSERLIQLATTMQDKFDATTQMVQDYYASKLVPNGKIVANYDVLVDDIQAKQDAVQISLINAQDDILGFNCTDNNPKTMLMQFNEDMRAVKQSLQNYRTSVKNLIVSVRSITGQENRANPSNKPSQNPGQGNSNRGGY